MTWVLGLTDVSSLASHTAKMVKISASQLERYIRFLPAVYRLDPCSHAIKLQFRQQSAKQGKLILAHTFQLQLAKYDLLLDLSAQAQHVLGDQ